MSVKRCLAAISVFTLLWFATLPNSLAQTSEITKGRATQRKSFSDAEIAAGFFRIAFGAELGLRGRVDRIRKYDGPVRIFVENNAKPDRRPDLQDIVDDIRARIANLDIAFVDAREEANFLVRLVRDRDVSRMVRSVYGARGREIVRSLDPQCLSGFAKDASYRITRSDVILASDAGDFIFYDCTYEELLQALGPIRDDTITPWTMFNDDVQLGFFSIYDQYILNIMYHPRIRPGMTRAQVRALLPEIMPDVRGFVARTNHLPR